MALLTTSIPQGWGFPLGTSPLRDWVHQIDDKEKLAFAESKKHLYDFSSIFYEVSYCAERAFFYTIGPQFINFEDEVLPLSARFSLDNGESFTAVEAKFSHRDACFNNAIITFPTKRIEQTAILFELTLANGDSRVFRLENHKKKSRKIVINTLQKDNEVKWILDWINYYRSMGVLDFCIYDNGSKNIQDVMGAIQTEINDDTSVHIVHWPYVYGIPQFNHSLFSQISTIVDFVFQSQSAKWGINCDIDEYIVLGDGYYSLVDLLEGLEPNVGCLQFGCSDAPLMRGLEYPDKISVRDLTWRTKEIRTKFKNAFRLGATRSASMHYVKLRKGLETVFVSEDIGFYLHARPLNTGWSAPARLRAMHRLESGDFVEEKRVKQRMLSIDSLDFECDP